MLLRTMSVADKRKGAGLPGPFLVPYEHARVKYKRPYEKSSSSTNLMHLFT
jgi:hypothetical protein